jgi:hypothetical protein
MGKVGGQSSDEWFTAQQSSIFRPIVASSEGVTVVKAPILFSAALACLLILAGCDSIYTDSPIGTSPATRMDARLIGGWKAVGPLDVQKNSPGEQAYFFFLPAEKNAGFRGVLISWNKTKNSDSTDLALDAVTGKAGDQWFFNVRNVFDEGKPDKDGLPGYRPYRYRFDADGSLEVFDWSPQGLERLKADVEQGRVEGKVTVQNYGTDTDGKPMIRTGIQITADQHSLDSYFAANAMRIFDKPVFTLQRVTDR